MERQRPDDRQMARFYRARFMENFGHMELGARMKVMQKIKYGYINGTTVRDLHEQLGSEMLIVPGNNQISMEQLTDAMYTYFYNKPRWNKRLDRWQRRKGNG